jgi:hypothetical protein
MRVGVGFLQQLDNASGGQPHVFECEVCGDDRPSAGSAELDLSHSKPWNTPEPFHSAVLQWM